MATSIQSTSAFPAEVVRKAYDLIHAGRERFGSFWKNRTPTSQLLGYGGWDAVDKDIKECLEVIRARRRNRAKKQVRVKKKKVVHTVVPAAQPKVTGFELTSKMLQGIWSGSMRIPKAATQAQILEIRKFITVKAGFDPAKILLGVDSRMEK